MIKIIIGMGLGIVLTVFYPDIIPVVKSAFLDSCEKKTEFMKMLSFGPSHDKIGNIDAKWTRIIPQSFYAYLLLLSKREFVQSSNKTA